MGKLLSGMLATLLLAGVSAAQQLVVTAGVLVQGQQVDISYTDQSRAGKTIQVRVSGGNPANPTVVWLPVVLNADGHGQTQWTANNWWFVCFNAPGVNEQARVINGEDDDEDDDEGS